MLDIFTDKRAVKRLKRQSGDVSLTDKKYKELLEEALDDVIDHINNPDPPLCVRSVVQEIAYLKYLQSKTACRADESNLKSYSYSEGDVSESASYSTSEESLEKLNEQIKSKLNSINHLRVVRGGIQKKNTE